MTVIVENHHFTVDVTNKVQNKLSGYSLDMNTILDFKMQMVLSFEILKAPKTLDFKVILSNNHSADIHLVFDGELPVLPTNVIDWTPIGPSIPNGTDWVPIEPSKPIKPDGNTDPKPSDPTTPTTPSTPHSNTGKPATPHTSDPAHTLSDIFTLFSAMGIAGTAIFRKKKDNQ